MDAMKDILDQSTIAKAIGLIDSDSFTVLDFIGVLRKHFRNDWRTLTDRFGDLDEKRRYTVKTYLSNRLDVYSHKPGSHLKPFIRYSQAKFKSYRRPTQEEKEHFSGSWIAVFEKK